MLHLWIPKQLLKKSDLDTGKIFIFEVIKETNFKKSKWYSYSWTTISSGHEGKNLGVHPGVYV